MSPTVVALFSSENNYSCVHSLRMFSDGLSEQITMKNLGDGPDCPVFEGMFDYCRSYTGGTIGRFFISRSSYIVSDAFVGLCTF